MKRQSYKQGVMVSSVEPCWAGLCAPPFDGAQGDSLLFLAYGRCYHRTIHSVP